MTESQLTRRWSTDAGAAVNAVQRPDGAWLLHLPENHVDAWSDLVRLVSGDLDGPLLVSRPEDQGMEADAALRTAGFVPVRWETVWRIPIAGLLAKPTVRTAHRIVSVTSLDADAVAELDNRIRNDIPGTEGWMGTGAQLIESLADPEFDPALYRVAQHEESARLDGLIRVWNRVPEPRLGCIGVTRPWRRTRLALALVQDIADTLHARGVTHITTETDTTNRNSHPMAIRQGGQAIKTTVEWHREADANPVPHPTE